MSFHVYARLPILIIISSLAVLSGDDSGEDSDGDESERPAAEEDDEESNSDPVSPVSLLLYSLIFSPNRITDGRACTIT